MHIWAYEKEKYVPKGQKVNRELKIERGKSMN